MKTRCLIVDDEELARLLLENYIGRMPNLELVGQCKDPLEAIPFLQEKQVDLLFLDIQMPGMTGTEFLRTLPEKPSVIFTTAYSGYAIESYSLDAADYLLKPFSFERFVQAVNKVCHFLQLKSSAGPPAPKERDFLLVKSEHKVHRIRYEDIRFIQSMREYVAYYLSNIRILSLNSLKSLEEELPPDRFLRIHKSYIISLDKVDTLDGNVVIVGKDRLPIGASYRDEVLARIFQ